MVNSDTYDLNDGLVHFCILCMELVKSPEQGIIHLDGGQAKTLHLFNFSSTFINISLLWMTQVSKQVRKLMIRFNYSVWLPVHSGHLVLILLVKTQSTFWGSYTNTATITYILTRVVSRQHSSPGSMTPRRGQSLRSTCRSQGLKSWS